MGGVYMRLKSGEVYCSDVISTSLSNIIEPHDATSNLPRGPSHFCQLRGGYPTGRRSHHESAVQEAQLHKDLPRWNVCLLSSPFPSVLS